MCPNEVAILAIINEKHSYELGQLKRATEMIEENFATCHSLCQQGYLERNKLGGLQVTKKGKYAVIEAFNFN